MKKPTCIDLRPIKYNRYIQDKMLRPVTSVVTTEKSIIHDGYELVVEDDDTCLRIGEEVYLQSSLGTRVFLEYRLEVDAFKAFQKQEKELKEANRIERRRQDSVTFWNSYEFPFKFSIEIKEVLSGLSDKGWANGTNKATVTHLYLHEDYKNGRFFRPANSFLCSESKSKWGANWSASLGENIFKDDIWDIPNVVECKQCLRLIQRFKKQTNNEQ